MRNNLLVTILFLASSSIILSQDLRIKNLQIESKNNGTVIQLDSNKKVNLENYSQNNKFLFEKNCSVNDQTICERPLP